MSGDPQTTTDQNAVDSGFRTSLQSGEFGKNMTNSARKNEVQRITSNLPEVYNRYFFTNDQETNQVAKGKKVKNSMNVTVPSALGFHKKGFS